MSLIKRFTKNEVGADYAVGDIHGAFTKLYAALEIIGFNPDTDRLFSVGDLVDRGAESPDYWKLLRKPWFHAVRGNHEDMAIKHYTGVWPTDNYISNGGWWNVNASVEEQKAAMEDFVALPFMIEVETSGGDIGIIHANTRGNSWKYMQENINFAHVQEHSMWSRDRIWGADKPISETDIIAECAGENVKYVKAVLTGHTPVKKVVKIGNVYHIDTMGWTDKGKFTFINLETLEIKQA